MILRQVLTAWAVLTTGTTAPPEVEERSTSLVTESTTLANEMEGKSPVYTTRFDYVNVDRFLSNTRLLNSYLACIMEKGPCTKEGNELKVILPDAIKTDCSKCTERQRVGIEKVTKYLSHNKKEQWKELVEKFDPEGTERGKYKLGVKEST